MFPNALMVGEGAFITPQNTVVSTVYVHLSGKLQGNTACLVKASEPQYDLATAPTIRLSRPEVFQQTGEVLIRDEQEGRVLTSKNETFETSSESSDIHQRRLKALNVGMQLSEIKTSINSKEKSKRTRGSHSTVTFGKDWLIYCTSICPSEDEEDVWRRSFPENYSTFPRIYRPTQFAQGLGLSVSEHIGANGKPEPMKATFAGFKTVEVQRRTQMIVHGPVLYVDNPYRCISEAEIGWEKICSMIFVKSLEYAAQKEYRFAVLSIKEEMGEVFDLPVSGMMRDCLLPTTFPRTEMETSPAVVSDDTSQAGEKRFHQTDTRTNDELHAQSERHQIGVRKTPAATKRKRRLSRKRLHHPTNFPNRFQYKRIYSRT